MKKQIRLIITIGLILLSAGAGLFIFQPLTPAAAQTEPITPADIQITLQSVANGFSRPIQATHAGDNSGRIFVVEQDGRIEIIKDGAVLGAPFLDITDLTLSPADGGGSEQGLLGLAFHPDYPANGLFFINYTDNNGNTVIARYQVSANPDVADSGSSFTVLTVSQPYSNHNGGQLLFGPHDGYLYIGLGDGGSGNDPQNNAQNVNSLLGKMLRLDIDGGTPYAIPSGNPLVGLTGRDEIWALGLRNPWRFSFDRNTGDIYIGDVGQNAWEEVSYQAADTPGGVNFGWRCREAAHDTAFAAECAGLSLTDPIAEYDHSEGNAITGGFVYRGAKYANLTGRYFFADYGTGKIWSIYPTGPNSWSPRDLELDQSFLISAFGEDEAGELYVVGYNNGTIYQLQDANGPSPNLSTSTKTVSTPHADPGEAITYTIRLVNSGGPSPQTTYLTDTLPADLTYVPGSLTASHGAVDDLNSTILKWQGQLTVSPITITYQVSPADIRGSLINQADISAADLPLTTLKAALYVPRPALNTTAADFFLPGTQPGQLTTTIPDSGSCDTCHTAPIFDKWRGSMMSQAGRDPLMWAALSLANNDAPGSGDYCLRCHTPKGWLAGRSHPADGSALQSSDLSDGIACEICHRMVAPSPSPTDEAVAIDSAIRSALTTTVPVDNPGSGMLIIDPADNRRGPFSLTPPHSAFRTDFLSQNLNAMTESRLCGSCHNVDNPALSWDSGRNQFWPNPTGQPPASVADGNLFPIETTFDEWANSEFSATGVYAPQFAGSKSDGIVRSCQDCHMRRATGPAAEAIYSPVNRDCAGNGCLPEHDLVGGNTWVPQLLQDTNWRLHSAADTVYLNGTVLRAREMLQKAALITATLTTSGTEKVATVRVINQTGHKLPTGYPEGRRMWLNIKAYDADDNLVYESGAYDTTTGELTPDSDIKIYEAKQGLTPELAAVLGIPAGESFHFVLNNTVIKDNRIPPRGYTQTNFDKPGLRPVGAAYADGQYWDDTEYRLPGNTDRVTVRLYYQTASKEYVDFLRANGGLDGESLGTLWNSSKSPPEIMVTAFIPAQIYYFPLIFKTDN